MIEEDSKLTKKDEVDEEMDPVDISNDIVNDILDNIETVIKNKELMKSTENIIDDLLNRKHGHKT